MTLAARCLRLAESATLRVSRRAAELRAAGASLVDLGAGQPDFDSPSEAVAAATGALAGGFTRYTAVAGTPELRSALAQRYEARDGAPWSPSNVLVTVGAKGALFELALALLEPGDEVVLPSPYWVSFPEQIRFAGATPVFVPTDPADGFTIRAEPLLAATTDRTKAILVNAPTNPTGGVAPAEELEALVSGAAERGCLLISDETYEAFVYDGLQPTSAAALAARYPDTVIVVGSFSKSYSMTGWRIGWAAGPDEVIGGAARIQGHATSNPTSFAMVGALAALQHCGAEVEHHRREFEARRDLLLAGLARLPGFECATPQGAFYAFPRVSSLYRDPIQDSVAFSELLLERAGVAVVPGAAFGADEHVRLSYACSREELEQALVRIERAITAHLGG